MSRARLFLGGAAWLFVIQYVVAEVLAIAAWSGAPYDVVADVVSDLGRPECRADGGCSAAHALFNASLGVHATLVVLGAATLAPLLPRWRRRVVGIFAVTALGNVMVGLFPLGRGVTGLHLAGAVLAIGGATVALGLVAVAVRHRRRGFAAFTVACAAVGATGLVLLGAVGTTGWAERLAIYPVTVWYVVTGALALRLSRDAVRR